MAVKSSSSKKLVRNSNTPSLKSQGAGYSTTDRKGNTTFYKSSKDAPGYNDTTQSRSNTSKGNAPISKFDAAGKAITPESLTKTSVLTTPTPTVTDPGNLAGQGNAQLASILSGVGYTQDPKGMIVPPPAGSAEEATANSNTTLATQLQSLLGLKKQEESQVDIYNQLAEKKALERAQREENAVANQINTLTANRDAAILSLEGQGRGQTSGFVGGEQARINREAAIQALPLQAQLSAAQGNREFAQQQLNTMFSLKVADSQAKTKFWNGIVDSAIGFATTAQQNILTAKLADINTKSQKEQTNLALMNSWAQMAVETGQSGLISQFTALDPNSPTFTADLGRLQAKVQKPVVSKGIEAPTVKTINGVDMQWNAETGQWETIGGAGIPGAPDTVQKSIDQLSFLRQTAQDALDNAQNTAFLRTPVGPSLITRLVGDTFKGNTSFRQLQNQTDTLKTNVLSLMTDPNVKKFFGPQMSNADVRLMSSTGSTLNPQDQSQKEYVAEIKRLDDLFNRMQTAVQQGVASQMTGPNIITGPDGNQYEFID